MRTSRKAKDAAAEKQSYVCDTFTGHGKAHQPPLPGSPVCLSRRCCSAKAATHTYREPDTWRGAIRGITHMLIVPQGFTCR